MVAWWWLLVVGAGCFVLGMVVLGLLAQGAAADPRRH